MKHGQTIKLCTLYAAVLCMIFAVSVLLLFGALQKSRSQNVQVQTEPVYVYVKEDRPVSDSDSETQAKERFLFQAYEGKIGIFAEDGRLVGMIDTDIKTLPKADQRMLGEGIYAENEAQYYALLEDYSE